MAYISTEEVKQIREQIKPVLKEKGLKCSLRRENYSKVVLTVKSFGKLVNEFFNEKFTSWGLQNFDDFTEEEKQLYFKYKKRQEEINEEKRTLEQALLLPNYRDNSDIMTDYFDVSYYTEVIIQN